MRDTFVYKRGILVRGGEDITGIDEETLSRAIPQLRELDVYYTDVKFKITLFIPTASGRSEEIVSYHEFANRSSMLTWLQTSLPSASGSSLYYVELEIMQFIEPSIPKLTKFWGMNALFSAMIGRNTYKGNHPTVKREYYRIGLVREVMQAIVGHYMGAGNQLYNLVTNANNQTLWDNVAKVFWTSTNYITNNGEPIPNAKIQLGIYRNYYDLSTNSIITIPTLPSYFEAILGTGPVPEPILVNLMEDKTLDLVRPMNYSNHDIYRRDILSTIIVYPIEFLDTTTGHFCRSFYIRPVSIDTLHLENIDFDKYDLCAVTYIGTKNKALRVIRTGLPEHNVESQDPTGSVVRIPIRKSLPIGMYKNNNVNSTQRNITNKFIPRIYYMLRLRNSGGLCGPLSERYVTLTQSMKRLVKYKFIIE